MKIKFEGSKMFLKSCIHKMRIANRGADDDKAILFEAGLTKTPHVDSLVE